MSIVGALAAAFALVAAQGDHQQRSSAGSQVGPAPIVARLAAIPDPGRTYLTGLVEAFSAHPSERANRRPHDGMSMRELRPADQSGQTMVPVLAGHF